MIRRRLLLEWIAIALLALAVTCGFVLGGMTSRIDNTLYDALAGLRAAPPSDRILIVAIDDDSIAEIGRWPWPRTVHARLIERIAAARPAAIAYDVLFPEPAANPREDAALAAAMRGTRVVLPILLTAPGANGRAFDATPPVEPLRSAATLGHVALPYDGDGSARAALLEVSEGGRTWLHLAEQAYRLGNGAPSPAFRRAAARGQPGVLVPYAPPGAFRTVPFKDVLAGSVPPEFLRGRFVLVGVTAGGLGDRHVVAGAGALPGVEVQANLLNALLTNRFIRSPSSAWQWAFAAFPSLLLLLLFLWLRPSRALVATAAIFVATAALPVVLLVIAGLWLPPTAALLALLIVYPLWGWRRLMAIHRAMSDELRLFAGDDEAPVRPARAGLDPAGSSAIALSSSIARLRDLKRLISDTIEGVSDPLIVTSLAGQVLLANGRAQALMAAELTPDTIMKLANAAEHDELTLADGRSFSPRRTPLADAAGEQRGWILLLAEITAIRAAQQDREEALEFLSHDMRAPQAAIIALLDGDGGKAVPEALSARLAGHARRTLRLADDFVQLARLRSTGFEPEETDVRDALAEAADAVWPVASRKGVRVVVDEGEPCWMMGERYALTRALLNLLDNAVKFSPDGAEVRCGVAEMMEAGSRWYEIAIEDAGPGIPPDRLSRLFARFGPVGRSGTQPSAGLGLSYAHAVAQRHGGSLSYVPVTPTGTRFVLRLPALSE
ncbi:CHASE2 domain-containing protein [Sphingomonas cannabina]|uniref:CHASE2 domain-containing protein n=1 Tax=Sphingomonas cannabina TaxID=2899123 RepID=UPI001F400C0E|nr:CHASE2 domain-containing protein [Sphingomonas cannabina]UIJ46644.1 CHASE2 domain-containing protein [Sphingomonas cannabina]